MDASFPKTLVVGLGSYKVKDTTGSDPTNIDRQTVYAIALNRLLKAMPKGTDVVIAENTIGSLADVTPVLQEELRRKEVIRHVFVQNNTLGAQNKGAGEYVMCRAVADQLGRDLEKYEWVIYFTSRYPMPFPLVFDYIAKHPQADAIMGNVSYLFSDGRTVPSAPGNFNDIIFAMRREHFLAYVESMNPELLAKQHMNSETNLFNFVHDRKLKFHEVHRWGTLRYDYKEFQMQVI
jgi:hypothetical protein